MTEPTELLPCPFCGGDARHNEHADACYFILHSKLQNSGADMSRHLEVLAAWNRRVAPAAMIGEPVFAFRRKGLDDFCICTEKRYAELSRKPKLFETRIFYTAPQQEAQEPVMIYHGRCPIDCGEHGHHNVELLRMIPAGSKLYTAPKPSPAAQVDALDAARLDWLALAGPVSICLVIDREHDGDIEVSADGATGYGKTLRAAIDTARKEMS